MTKANDGPTLGNALDDLGILSPPGFQPHRIIKALIITISDKGPLEGISTIVGHPVGAIGSIEALGLLDLVRRDLLSERRQDEGLRHAFSNSRATEEVTT